MAAAEGLGGPGDVGDAVHGGGRGARGRGHKDGQMWHLGQVDDAWREKREDCQDDAEPLAMLERCWGVDPSHGSGTEQEVPEHMWPSGVRGGDPSVGKYSMSCCWE